MNDERPTVEPPIASVAVRTGAEYTSPAVYQAADQAAYRTPRRIPQLELPIRRPV